MTARQKADIISLRSSGLTFSEIAEKVKLSVNTVKSFYRRAVNNNAKFVACKYCRTPIIQPKSTREKKFCSDKCRMAWWNSHRDEVNKKSVYDFKRECCGKAFQAYSNAHRKYCGRDCYIKMRFGGENS